uniref:adenylate cyclase n=1 Tax=Glossina morsitans morsitans TaxID=37546 RepID=A0A1B0FMT2_GLOMM
MPIKFLGDCYSAVSGIPTSHPLHSVCCIEFGLSIITHIRDVRTIKQLDIDMRIGIHSGSLLGGIIGASKWQYDVWSIDVDIANRLEATGMPGRVHVSNNTLQLAQDFYVYENGTEKATLDPVLVKNNVRTFLIIEKSDTMLKSQDWQNYRKMNEEARRRRKTESVLVVSYQDIISDANKAMEAEVDKLPVCKLQFIKTCFAKSQVISYDEIREHLASDGSISSVFLQFNDLSMELNYLTSQRISVYLLPVVATSIVLTCIIISQAMSCDSSVLENDFEMMIQLVEQGERTLCFNAWTLTQSVCLFSALTFAWPRAPFLFSITISLTVILFNVVTIFSTNSIDYESSIPTNVGLTAEFDHVWSLLVMWQLKKEMQESKTTSASIKVLLRNMLPAHVVDAYLRHRVNHEPYYEYHRSVAVMFATVLPDASLTMDLGLKNDIICHFDEVLSMYRSALKVEKIKVVNGTYMAACGLSAESAGRSSIFLSAKKGVIDVRSHRFLRRIAKVDIHHFLIHGRGTTVSRPSEDTDSNEGWVSEQSDAEADNKKQTVVHRMASFALDLLKTVQKLNVRLKEQRGLTDPPLSLRVGISSGEIAAGIVGYTTSHYDIWGNAVNMASRMDSTGVANRIQVCEQTANILAEYDIVCSYRGMTYIKSLGELPTYFIEIDELLNFIYKGEQNDISSQKTSV